MRAALWPVLVALALFIGWWIGDALRLPSIVKLGLGLLAAFGGFMLVILTHPDRD